MAPAAFIMYAILAFWIVGGSVWLLRRRQYRLAQTGQFAMDLLGFPVELAQSIWGREGVPYAFLLPNMALFGIFTFFPMILNFWVSLTGGESIALLNRPYVGAENYRDIFSCTDYLVPKTCSNNGYTFWTGMYNTLIFVIFQVPILCVVALITALVVNKSLAGRGFWRAMFFYPVMLSPVVIANIWQWILNRKGVLNQGLDSGAEAATALARLSGFDIVLTIILAILLLVTSERTWRGGRDPSMLWASLFIGLFWLVFTWADPLQFLGVSSPWIGSVFGLLIVAGFLWMASNGHSAVQIVLFALGIAAVIMLLSIQFDAVFNFEKFKPVNWLVTRNTGWPFFWLVFVFTWSHMGFYMLILLAGLQAIPSDLYEAAKMDATKPVRVFFRITLPLVMPTFTVVVVLSLIRSFQVFDEVYLLTGGGPGRETFMIVQNIFETAFTGDNPKYGAAAAGSVLMAIVIAVFTFFQLFITRRQSEL
ncbi:MAG: carbohydrate ABC transporter permease [Marinosulfonomonas sp.]